MGLVHNQTALALSSTAQMLTNSVAYHRLALLACLLSSSSHGLPVEYEIDQKLGIKTKDDVMKMGVAAYNAECRSIVQRYVKEWETSVRRMGRWIDFEHDYKTMDTAVHGVGVVGVRSAVAEGARLSRLQGDALLPPAATRHCPTSRPVRTTRRSRTPLSSSPSLSPATPTPPYWPGLPRPGRCRPISH